MHCIYAILNKVDGKTYVGKHKYQNVEDPLGNYWGSGYIIKKAISKYGKESFKRFILRENIPDNHMASLWEIAFIRAFKEYGMCEYNITKGGDGGNGGKNKGQTRTPEQREKFRQAQLKLYANGYVCHNKGKHRTEEEKEVLRKKCSGWHHTKEAKESMSKKRLGHKYGNVGMHWFNNGVINRMCKDCPDGFIPGMIKRGE